MSPRRHSRRQFIGRMGGVLSWASLAALMGAAGAAGPAGAQSPGPPNFAPRAKRAISLFMSGAPPQMDLLDYKPRLAAYYDSELPDSVRGSQTLTGMTAGQSRFPITGNMVPGKPSLGAWLSYGLGNMNENLPAFVVLNSRLIPGADNQPIAPRLWGSGFLSSEHAGVAFRSQGDPVLYLNDPDGMSRETRRALVSGINAVNQLTYEEVGDPETHARIRQYEMAFRMQTSVPELTDTANEPKSTWELYGDDARVPGTFAYNCLLARRMAERGVRFTQIYQRGWDVHKNVVGNLPKLCAATDRGCYALVTDLQRRGLLADTLVIWGGEFGRTVYSQGGLTRDNYGRDHHPRCFTMWMAGGGANPGIAHGQTDDFSYNIVEDPVHVRDINATVLHLLGIDHEKLTYRFQGLDQKLTGVVPAKVVTELLA